MQICTSPRADNHASTPPLNFLQAGCPSCRPNNSIKALKAELNVHSSEILVFIVFLQMKKNENLHILPSG